MTCTICTALEERKTKVLANERGVEMTNQSEQAWTDWYVRHEWNMGTNNSAVCCEEHKVELAASLIRLDKATTQMQLCRSCELLFPRLFGETQCMFCREGIDRKLS